MLGPRLEPVPGTGPVGSLFEGWWASTAAGTGVIVPDGAVDLIRIGGRTPLLAGPDTRWRSSTVPEGTRVVGLRLRAGTAPALLGTGTDQVTDLLVPLDGLGWHRVEIDRLDQALGTATSDEAAALALAGAATGRVPDGWRPDPLVTAAVDRFRSGSEPDHDGLGPRQFRRRFTRAMGYGPTFYHRVQRLDRFTTLLDRHPDRSLAELAATAGYHDESHASRDAVALTGSPPGRLRRG